MTLSGHSKRVKRTKITKERRTAKESALTAMLNNSRSNPRVEEAIANEGDICSLRRASKGIIFF